ncbi:MAG: cryptochrome/photolyase family protein [Sphingomonas bacterium]|nr:cryptochrome/photolyase family protein [Sphingomonas bacterium]
MSELGGNPRLTMPYRNWGRWSANAQPETRAQAAAFLDNLDAGGPGGY